MNKFLRETFNGSLPEENPIHLLKNGGSLKKANDLTDDVQQFIYQSPGSFVCTGGTELQYESQNATKAAKITQSATSSKRK